MRMIIELEGGATEVVEVDARDRRAFEKTGLKDLGVLQRGPLRDIVQSQPEGYVAWLVWHALARQGRTDLRWAAFEPTVVSVQTEPDDEDGSPLGDPTGLARLGG